MRAPPQKAPCQKGRAAKEVDTAAEEYFEMVGLDDERLLQRGCVLHEVSSSEARGRWAAARARHHPGGRANRGCDEGTIAATNFARGQLIVCSKCNMPVQLQAARRLARKAGRASIAGGDGCAAAGCTSSHAQPVRTARTLEGRAAGVLSGARALVLPPPTTASGTDLWMAPPELALTLARSWLAIACPTSVARPAVQPRQREQQEPQQEPQQERLDFHVRLARMRENRRRRRRDAAAASLAIAISTA